VAALLVLGVLAALPARLTSAVAAVPGPADGVAVVDIKIASDRTSVSTIGPLSGEEYGLFARRPTHFTFDGIVDLVAEGANQPLYRCTSDLDGDCVWTVPIGSGAGAVPAETRLWTGPITMPPGYYANPVWQTGPLTGADSQYISTPRMFQTPALQAGQVYTAGAQWITTPGIATDTSGMPAGLANGTSTAAGSYRQRISSGGITVAARVNPASVTSCGRRVALVVDLSSSMNGQVANLKSALDAIVDGLRGTPSEIALFTFSTSSPAVAAQNYDERPVATTAQANAFKQLYAGWNNSQANGYTNWDAGLYRVSQYNASLPVRRQFDTAIVLTDGNPTAYANGTTGDALAGYTRFRELGNAVASANALKAQGVRVLSFGVGAGIDERAGVNLRSISGRQEYDGTNLTTASYFQESDYSTVGAQLHSLVLDACAPSISVIKQVVPDGGGLADAYTPTIGWQFTASPSAGTSVDAPSKTTDATTGGVNFDLTFDAGTTSGSVGVTETPKAGYTPFQNGSSTSCEYIAGSRTGSPATITVTGGGAGFEVADVRIDDAVSCVVYNQAPASLDASVVVEKLWRVRSTPDGSYAEYANQSQPPGLQAALLLDGPGADDPSSDQPWGTPRGGYTSGADVQVQERPTIGLPGCELTRSTIRAGTSPGTGTETDLSSGAVPTATVGTATGDNAWTITNYVTCVSRLTLSKEVLGGPADPASWVLRAVAPGGALPGPQGVVGSAGATQVTVTPNVSYQLAEQPSSADPAMLVYVQDDSRTLPLQHPESTGSMYCVVVADPGGDQLGDAEGMQGNVTVPLGQDVTCTATNRAAALTIIKAVDGGDAVPGDFAFRLTPVVPHPDGLPSVTVLGAADPGTTVAVRPGQAYEVVETRAPGHYQLGSFDCAVGARAVTEPALTVPSGTSAVCTATNVYSTWTATKSSDPKSGSQVLPGSLITYSLTARRLEGAPTRDVSITDDLSGVLDHASFVSASLVASAGQAVLDGTTLTWTIDELSSTATVSYQVRVDDDAYAATLTNSLTRLTTTEPGGPGDPAVPCGDLPGGSEGCDGTTHRTPPSSTPRPSPPSASPPPVPPLAQTGTSVGRPLAVGLLLLGVGSAAVAAVRVRRRER